MTFFRTDLLSEYLNSPLDLHQYRKIFAEAAFQLIFRIQIDLREQEFDQLLLKHRIPTKKMRKVGPKIVSLHWELGYPDELDKWTVNSWNEYRHGSYPIYDLNFQLSKELKKNII